MISESQCIMGRPGGKQIYKYSILQFPAPFWIGLNLCMGPRLGLSGFEKTPNKSMEKLTFITKVEKYTVFVMKVNFSIDLFGVYSKPLNPSLGPMHKFNWIQNGAGNCGVLKAVIYGSVDCNRTWNDVKNDPNNWWFAPTSSRISKALFCIVEKKK